MAALPDIKPSSGRHRVWAQSALLKSAWMLIRAFQTAEGDYRLQAGVVSVSFWLILLNIRGEELDVLMRENPG